MNDGIKPKSPGGASRPPPPPRSVPSGGSRKTDAVRGGSRAAAAEPATEALEQPASATAPVAPSMPTLSAMQLPQVSTASKRKYPGASASDANRPAQNGFEQKFGRELRGRLKQENLSVKDLPKSKEASAVVQREVDARAAEKSASGAVFKAMPELSGPTYNQVLRGLIPLVRKRSQAQAKLSSAEREETWTGDAQKTRDARAAFDKADGAVNNALPPWAAAPETASLLLKAVQAAVKVQSTEAATNHAVRAVQVQLGDRTLTKGTHFAEGAFGKVAMARNVEDGTPRAVKILRTTVAKRDGSTEVSDLEDTRREVGYMQRFYAPDVTLSHDPHTEKLIIEMPLALGSLDHLQADAPLVRSTGRQVFERLAEMHAAEVGHNDMKTANINVHGDGRILPADFGKARPLAGASDPGTLQYAAPEQMNPQPDVRGSEADVWAAGLSLADSHKSIDDIFPLKMQNPQRQAALNIPGFEDDDEDMVPLQPGQMIPILAEYADWHATHVDSAAKEPLRGVLEDISSSEFSTYFKALHRIDPDLCHILLTRVLVPRASERASAAEASAAFARLQPADSDVEQQLRTRLAEQDQSPARRAAQVALELRAKMETNPKPQGR